MLKNRLIFGIIFVFTVALTLLFSSCQKPAYGENIVKSEITASSIAAEDLAVTPVVTKDVPSPDEENDISHYRLNIYGLVDNPMSLTYEEILSYPAENERAGLYCDNEFLSAYTWSGISVSTLLTEAGIQPGTESIVFYAKDGYSQTLTPDDVMPGGVILAYAAEGEKISEGDGYPLRLVANGYNGSYWVRWVVGIEVK